MWTRQLTSVSLTKNASTKKMVISSDIIVPTWRCVNGIKVLKTSRLIWVSPRVGRVFGKHD